MNRLINKVFNCDALDLLRVIPTASIDAVIADAMHGTAKNCRYEWGLDPRPTGDCRHERRADCEGGRTARKRWAGGMNSPGVQVQKGADHADRDESLPHQG